MSLKRETIKLSIITGISILGNFIFHIFLGRRFGVSWRLDCFFVVLMFFGWLGFFNTFITSLYIPIFNEVKKNDTKDSLIFVDVVLKWAILMSILIVFFVLMFNDLIIKTLAPGFAGKGINLAKEINRIIIFAFIFFNISYTVTLTLNALYYYSIPALMNLFDPLFNISAIFILTPTFGIKGIVISYLLSNFFKASILLIYLRLKTGWKPTLYFYHPKLPELINKSSKMAFSGFAWNLRNIITRNLSSRLGEGAVTLFSYAEKIIDTLIKVGINPLMNVFYSRVSEWVSLSNWADIKFLFMRAVRVNIFLSSFIISGSILFLPDFLKVLFYGSRFTTNDIYILSKIFNIMLIYFIILSFDSYLSRIIFATKRIGVVAINTSLGVSVLFISALILSKKYGIYGLPLGFALAQFLVCVLYYIFVRKSLELHFFKLIYKFLNAFIMAIVFFALGAVASNLITNNLIIVFVIMPIWLILYLVAAKVFLKEEMKILLSR